MALTLFRLLKDLMGEKFKVMFAFRGKKTIFRFKIMFYSKNSKSLNL